MTNAILLLSGGLDSVVSYACVKTQYKNVLALTFDYNQKAVENEIKAARNISNFYGIKNKIIKLDWLSEISNSALNNEKKIPQLNEYDMIDEEFMKKASNVVWVPNRNAVFINIAASFAEALNYDEIILGANKEEGKTFIDNSSEFINAINNSLKYSLNSKVIVKAPLIDMSKNEIVEKGIELNIPFKFLYSCYNGGNIHCAKCESCQHLKRALEYCERTDIVNNLFGEKI